MRYMPALASTLRATYTQNMTSMVRSSHDPCTPGIPYSQMLMNIVPMPLLVRQTWLKLANEAQLTTQTTRKVSHVSVRNLETCSLATYEGRNEEGLDLIGE
jgi:hypothetical protein